MATIIEFSQRVAERFERVQETYRATSDQYMARFFLGLSPETVAQLVTAAYDASMIPDEGRFPTARLLCYQVANSPAFHFRLRDPLEPTAVEIAKLAHGADVGSHLCVLCENGKPALAGIHVTTLDEMRQFGFASFRTGNPLRIVIRGPGHMAVSDGGAELVFRFGEISEEEPLLFSDVLAELEFAISLRSSEQAVGQIDCLSDIFNELAKAIVRLGHGGLLLLLEHPDWDQFSSYRRTDSQLLSQLLVRYVQETKAAVSMTRESPEPHSDPDSWSNGASALKLSTTTAMLENCVRSIGHLSGLDGAIVMDGACNVIAFNAIVGPSEGADPADLVDEIGRILNTADLSKNRGSRHQSAMSFARRVPHSYGFVISQDGGITAFHNRGDGTVRWERGLRVFD